MVELPALQRHLVQLSARLSARSHRVPLLRVLEVARPATVEAAMATLLPSQRVTPAAVRGFLSGLVTLVPDQAIPLRDEARPRWHIDAPPCDAFELDTQRRVQQRTEALSDEHPTPGNLDTLRLLREETRRVQEAVEALSGPPKTRGRAALQAIDAVRALWSHSPGHSAHERYLDAIDRSFFEGLVHTLAEQGLAKNAVEGIVTDRLPLVTLASFPPDAEKAAEWEAKPHLRMLTALTSSTTLTQLFRATAVAYEAHGPEGKEAARRLRRAHGELVQLAEAHAANPTDRSCFTRMGEVLRALPVSNADHQEMLDLIAFGLESPDWIPASEPVRLTRPC